MIAAVLSAQAAACPSGTLTPGVAAFILVSVFLAAAAQLTLKYGVDRVSRGGAPGIVLARPGESAARVVRQPAVWGGLALFGLSAAFWMLVLSRISLSLAYPFAALTYVLILVVDRMVLRVRVPALRWAGVASIMAGIVLVSRSGVGC
ncbi:MAG: hypothetical protein M3245_04235 [Actinomycetota bacterium]|nr:hypothetical protein [Actinomycetota bacterium]